MSAPIRKPLSPTRPESIEACYMVQLHLRRSLLDQRSTIRSSASRDLAAHMLLHLESPAECWTLAAQWMRQSFACTRVDIGLGNPLDRWYAPGFAEAVSFDVEIGSVKGHRVSNRDAGVRQLWGSANAIIFDDTASDARFGTDLRQWFHQHGARCKVARRLDYQGKPLALACIDWFTPHDSCHEKMAEDFDNLCREVLGPILAGTTELLELERNSSEQGEGLSRLTISELAVARLAAYGLRYKEIASRLDRSFSTIDHQLRSIRAKLGVTNHAGMVGALVKHLKD